ncbi:MAG: tetratricopeptide repeat protein [Gammaproteobacteria bacterium]|nr:tetratricopeptide repeat protein [Gammaproteobacteria bacterium]
MSEESRCSRKYRPALPIAWLLLALLAIAGLPARAEELPPATTAEQADRYFQQGKALRKQRRYTEAIEAFQQALAYDKDRRPAHAAYGLHEIGDCYRDQQQFQQAIPFYEQSLELTKRHLGEESGSYATILNNLAGVYESLGQYAEAKVRYEQALAIFEKELGPEHANVATLLNNLALVYQKLGQYAEAKARYERALAIWEKVHGPEHGQVAIGLNNLALVYDNLGQYAEAKVRYERALAIWEKVHGPEHGQVAIGLNNLAGVYYKLGQCAEAKVRYERALAIDEKVFGPEHPDVAQSLSNLARVYESLGQYAEAKVRYERALAIALRARQPELLWKVQGNLSDLYTKQDNPATAIFYGKQAVNTLQMQRGALQQLGQDLQKSFLKTVEGYYKDLSDLLVNQGRLPEAQQVLDMLKESEYLDFTQRDLPADATIQANYNSLESEQLALMDKAAEPLQALREPLDKLNAIKAELRTPEQQQQLQALREQWNRAAEGFRHSLRQIEQGFARVSEQQARQLAAKLQLDTDHRQLVKNLGDDVLLLQYLVLEDQSRILVTGKDDIQAFTLEAGSKQLNPLIQRFYSQLKDPRQDPRPLGQQLHDHLIQPLEALLAEKRPKTLMLYLDGVLRYIPFGALYDGKQYLAERYALPIYTAAARKQLDGQRQEQWRIAGLGASQAHGEFPALPAVKDELNGIVKSGPQDSNGILPGVIHLDEQFTSASLQDSLQRGYPVLHLATHFSFSPGNETRSFLLLGNGDQLDLGRLRTEANYKFQGIDLLTLSACETALDSPGAKGQEIEGLGTLAQKKGAKGVLATLWPVADNYPDRGGCKVSTGCGNRTG